MPHLTIPLDEDGPIIHVQVGLSDARAQAAVKAGQLTPSPERVRGLIDTGASMTAIDWSIVGRLSLLPTGSVEISTPSTGDRTHRTETYDISMRLEAAEGVKRFGTLPAVGSDLVAREFDVLVGRDVLESCLLIYDGSHQLMTLAF